MFVESFRNEVRAVARARPPAHRDGARLRQRAARTRPNAAAVSSSPARPYLSMELVEGDTLADQMGTLPWPEIERLLRGLLDALAHAHARGVIHRDLEAVERAVRPGAGTVQAHRLRHRPRDGGDG